VAAVISLFLPKWFTAESSLLPPSENTTGLNFLSGITEVPFNFTIPGLQGVIMPSLVYTEILRSRTVTESVINKLKLMDYFKTNSMEEAVKALNDLVNIDISEANVITVKVTTKNPELSARIANSLLEELDRVNKEKRITSARFAREFIEKRVKETEKDLEKAANRLKEFQKKYKAISVDDQIKAEIETIATLKSEIALKEVEYNLRLHTLKKDHPQIVKLQKNIEELKKQVSKIEKGINLDRDSYTIPFSEVPDLSYKMGFLMKDKEVLTAVYKMLVQQLEQAKIQEKKDTPTVQVLDYARIPEKKSRPKRSLIVIIAGIISLIVSSFYIIFNEYILYIREYNKEKYEKICYAGGILKNDLYKITRIPFLKKKNI